MPTSAAGGVPGTVGVWVNGGSSAWTTANNGFGPLASSRIFYNSKLPASYTGSSGSDLPPSVTLVVSYNTPDVNVASYVCSIPSTRNVILDFYHEPENATVPYDGPAFVAAFVAQSAEIRQAAASCGVTTVKVANISMTWSYALSTRRGYSCSFIPPATSVDYYLADTYEKDEDTLALDPGFQRWNACTAGSVPQGLAEYGVGLGNATATGCQFTDTQRAAVIQNDETYLYANFPNLMMWEYSWVADPRCWADWQFPVGGPSAALWQSIADGVPPPPVVSFTQPAAGATVRGAVTVAGTASPTVTQVQVSVDGGLPQPAVGTSNWTAAVDSTTLADGPHTITVQGMDASGAVGTASVSVTVDNTTPVTSCPAPATGVTELSGNVSLESSQAGWTGVYNKNSALSRVAPTSGSYDGTWALQVTPKASGAAGVNNATPLWVPGAPGTSTTAGQAYVGSAVVQANVAGEKLTLLVRENSPSGKTIGSKTTTITSSDTNWHPISTTYAAKSTGDVLHYSLYGSNFTSTAQNFLADCLSLQTP